VSDPEHPHGQTSEGERIVKNLAVLATRTSVPIQSCLYALLLEVSMFRATEERVHEMD
jgi:hypothetical protein